VSTRGSATRTLWVIPSNGEIKMIHICFSVHDKIGAYSKYLGAAICSILENTKEKINIHILHDETLNEANRNKLNQLVKNYRQDLCFYNIQIEKKWIELKALRNFTVGTLFRLKMMQVLPLSIEKLIFLDTDIIVNMDIQELWNQDFGSNLLLARKDSYADSKMRKSGLLDSNTYVNAGVLVLDVFHIRKLFDLYKMSIEFFKNYPECNFADQDALNYIFRGKIGFLDEKFNIFTSLLKQSGKSEKCIYHFAAECPHAIGNRICDQLFLKFLLKTPWGDNVDIVDLYIRKIKGEKQRINYIKSIYKRCEGKKKIFWGVNGVIGKKIIECFQVDINQDYCVDNNPTFLGKNFEGLKTYSSQFLLKEDKEGIVVIVLSKKYYLEIKEQLISYGLKENEHFFDGRRLLAEEEGGYFVL